MRPPRTNATASPEARAAMHEMMAAFEAFKGANSPTTEPKDVLGGDVAAQQRSAQSPSDPPPVREPWGWVAGDMTQPGSYVVRTAKDRDDAVGRGLPVAPLFLGTPVLPVSREAVEAARRVRGWVDCGMPDQSDNIPTHDLLKRHLRLMIAALTGETSRE